MKEKFKKLLLVVLVGIFAFSSANIVGAISSRGDLPVSYEVVGFNVFIFNDKGMTQTQSEVTDESIKSFPVEGLKYNTTDEVKSENGYTLVSTKLNVDGGAEALEKIAENIASVNKDSLKDGRDGKYLITFSVKYKLTLPDNTSVYDSDYANVFSGDQKLLKEETEANAQLGLDQMLIAGVYDSNTDTVDWNNQAQYVYNVEGGTHTFTSRSYDMPNFDQYLIFTNDKKPGDRNIESQADYVMAENFGEAYRYMMYVEESSSQIVDDNPSGDEPSTDEPSTNPTPSDPSGDEPTTDEPSTNPTPSDPSDDEPTTDEPSTNPTPSNPSDNNNDKPSDVTPSEPSKDQNDDDDKQDVNTVPVTPNDNNNNNNNNSGSDTSVTESNSTNNNAPGQTLSVPNTANDSNTNLTLSGILLLASGFGIVKLTKKEEENSI